MAEGYKQHGKDWLPSKSPGQKLNWSGRLRPVRAVQSWERPFDYVSCDHCYEVASWYCDACAMYFCRFDSCKEIHEYEHTISRLAGERQSP